MGRASLPCAGQEKTGEAGELGSEEEWGEDPGWVGQGAQVRAVGVRGGPSRPPASPCVPAAAGFPKGSG